jgi:hypothetical protein
MGIFEYARLAFDIRLWKWLVRTLDNRLWRWSDTDISHLWKRYKAVVAISPRAVYTRMPA